jgi:diaminopimelate decarboxylase
VPTTKQPYTPINISKLENQKITISKHVSSNISYSKPIEPMWYDKLDCNKLTQRYGSPLFVASKNYIVDRLNHIKKIFSFPGYELVIGYSFKTNYLAGICRTFLDEGCWAEVVSEMEYELAKRLSVKGENIIFNGPHKTDEGIEQAISLGSILHLDNFQEYERVRAIAAKIKMTAKVGIRFNFQYHNYIWDKFGFRFNEDELNCLFEDMAKQKYIDFVSLHNHCGTYILEPDLYRASVDTMHIIVKMALKHGLAPHMLDIGGGMPSTAPLREKYTAGYISGTDINLAVYADSIAPGLERIKNTLEGHGNNRELKLVIEPGRALIDEAVVLITSVVATKKGANNADITLIDAGVNILPTTTWYNRTPKVVGKNSMRYEKQRLCGPLCMQIDVINEGIYLPELETGDQLIIPNVGAYNQTQSMQFIQCRPAAVLMDENMKPTLIQRKENFDDIFIRDVFTK